MTSKSTAWRKKNPEKYKKTLLIHRSKPETKIKLRENTRRYRAKPEKKQKERERQVLYRQALKQMIYTVYGDRCACCGESNKFFLSVDHIKNDGCLEKQKGKRPGGRDLYGKIIKEGFPQDKYQILCMNCNHGKARNGGVCPHKLISK